MELVNKQSDLCDYDMYNCNHGKGGTHMCVFCEIYKVYAKKILYIFHYCCITASKWLNNVNSLPKICIGKAACVTPLA